MIRVQQKDFDIAKEISSLTARDNDFGAVVTFTGIVRSTGEHGKLKSLTLEHYPGMTERELDRIEQEAQKRWALSASLIIHRFGKLIPGDNIVLVITTSPHRQAAFQAAEFLMDYLKTDAPFWKQETNDTGNSWIDARETDLSARHSWE